MKNQHSWGFVRRIYEHWYEWRCQKCGHMTETAAMEWGGKSPDSNGCRVP